MAGEFEDVNSLPPSGLLGLFGIKTNGRAPRPLDSLQFTYGVEQFYTQSYELSLASATVTNTGNAFNQILTGAVPWGPAQGRGWLVTGVFGYITTAATGYWRGAMYVGRNTGPASWFPVIQLTNEFASNPTPAAVAGSGAGALIRPPVLLAPGDNIGVWLSQSSGTAAASCQWYLRYLEFNW